MSDLLCIVPLSDIMTRMILSSLAQKIVSMTTTSLPEEAKDFSNRQNYESFQVHHPRASVRRNPI